MGHLWTSHTLGYQKHSMETMIVARFFRAAVILQSENNGGRVGNGKWFHSSMKSFFMGKCPVCAISYVAVFSYRKISSGDAITLRPPKSESCLTISVESIRSPPLP